MGGRKVFLNRDCVGSTGREGADQAASNAPYDSPKSGPLYLPPHAGLQSTRDLSHGLLRADRSHPHIFLHIFNYLSLYGLG